MFRLKFALIIFTYATLITPAGAADFTFRVPVEAQSSTRDIKTAIFKRKKQYYLVAVNNGDEDKSASIHLPGLIHSKWKLSVRDLATNSRKTYALERGMPLTLDLVRKNGRVLELTPQK